MKIIIYNFFKVEDYSARKHQSVETTERSLSVNLAYEP